MGVNDDVDVVVTSVHKIVKSWVSYARGIELNKRKRGFKRKSNRHL
jgi:hypothetical protein